MTDNNNLVSKPALASMLTDILLTPWIDGPIQRIEAAVDRVLERHNNSLDSGTETEQD